MELTGRKQAFMDSHGQAAGPTGRGRVDCGRWAGSRLLQREKGRRKPVAEGLERPGGGWIGVIQGQGCRPDGRFPGRFSRNTRVMLPILRSAGNCRSPRRRTMTGVESVVQPNCVADDFRREPMAFVCVHPPILSISPNLLVSTFESLCSSGHLRNS